MKSEIIEKLKEIKEEIRLDIEKQNEYNHVEIVEKRRKYIERIKTIIKECSKK
jgi:protoheme ferro-lyase